MAEQKVSTPAALKVYVKGNATDGISVDDWVVEMAVTMADGWAAIWVGLKDDMKVAMKAALVDCELVGGMVGLTAVQSADALDASEAARRVSGLVSLWVAAKASWMELESVDSSVYETVVSLAD